MKKLKNFYLRTGLTMNDFFEVERIVIMESRTKSEYVRECILRDLEHRRHRKCDRQH